MVEQTMTRPGWGYKGVVQPNEVGHVWSVVAVIVGGGVFAITAAVLLPHASPPHWDWVALGFALMAAMSVPVAVLARSARVSGGTVAPPPLVAFGLAMGFLVALLPIVAGLSEPYGLAWPVLLLPALVVTAFAQGRMVFAAGAATAVALWIAARLDGASSVSAVGIVAVFGGVAITILYLFHRIQLEAEIDINRHRELGRLATAILGARDLESALDGALPICSVLLDAASIEVRVLQPGQEWREGRVAHSWRGAAPTVGPVGGTTAPIREQRPREVRISVPAPEPPGVLVLQAETTPTLVGHGLARKEVIQQVTSALELLVERVQLQAQLEARSRTDALTGLANRRVLFERLALEVESSGRDGRPLAVAMIDIDHFKRVNDDFGHQMGDAILVAFADLLTDRLRITDLACRYGGEEFCVILPRTSPSAAWEVADDLHRRCKKLDSPEPITFSAGIAEWLPHESFNDLIRRADVALYEAKVAGRDRTVAAGSLVPPPVES
jgi:diguanylate cyclase (GGDEF)-like protein